VTLRLMNDDVGGNVLRTPGWEFYPPYGHEAKSSEELYDIIPSMPPQPRGNTGGMDEDDENEQKQQPKPGAGCGVSPPENAQEGSGASGGGSTSEGAQARAMAGAGTVAGKALARLLTVPEPRVKWSQVLRGAASHALSQHGCDEQTWARRARRAPVGIILPGWQATRAKVAVVIDASGSVSDEQLARFVAETTKIGQTLAGVQIFLVVHDAGVQWAGWLHISRPEQVQRTLKGRGGTCFDVAYAAVREAPHGNFDVMVHLTDGECWGAWSQPPRNTRRFIAALVGNRSQPRPAGALTIRVED
jgi:VWA-like domain (DUF2201)